MLCQIIRNNFRFREELIVQLMQIDKLYDQQKINSEQNIIICRLIFQIEKKEKMIKKLEQQNYYNQNLNKDLLKIIQNFEIYIEDILDLPQLFQYKDKNELIRNTVMTQQIIKYQVDFLNEILQGLFKRQQTFLSKNQSTSYGFNKLIDNLQKYVKQNYEYVQSFFNFYQKYKPQLFEKVELKHQQGFMSIFDNQYNKNYDQILLRNNFIQQTIIQYKIDYQNYQSKGDLQNKNKIQTKQDIQKIYNNFQSKQIKKNLHLSNFINENKDKVKQINKKNLKIDDQKISSYDVDIQKEKQEIIYQKDNYELLLKSDIQLIRKDDLFNSESKAQKYISYQKQQEIQNKKVKDLRKSEIINTNPIKISYRINFCDQGTKRNFNKIKENQDIQQKFYMTQQTKFNSKYLANFNHFKH